MEAESLINGVTLGRTIAVLALVVGLILLISWVLRRNGMGAAFSRSSAKFKRLSVVEMRPIDNQRRLVLVERDNTQHLLLIGGDNDLVIETNISHKPNADIDPVERVRFRDSLLKAADKSEIKPAPTLKTDSRMEPTAEDAS